MVTCREELARAAQRLRAQVNQYIRAKAELFALLTSHTTITGTGRENALREFVDDLIPRRYEALTGTLAPAPQSDSGRSQVDPRIDNTLDFPVLVRDGGLAVVLPQSVEVGRCALDKDGLRSTLDLPDYVMTSGSQGACIATLESNSVTEVGLAVFAVEPVDTISYLLNRILSQLTPKPLGDPSDPSNATRDGLVVQARDQEQAWSWINRYFDIEREDPIEKVIELPAGAPAPPLTGDE